MESFGNDHGTACPKTQNPSLVSKLERSERELGRLRHLLNSHVCEPTTPDLFERIETLKGGLERLGKKNREIMGSLYPKGTPCDDLVQRSEEQLSESGELRKGVREYIRDINANRRRLRYDDHDMVPP